MKKDISSKSYIAFEIPFQNYSFLVYFQYTNTSYYTLWCAYVVCATIARSERCYVQLWMTPSKSIKIATRGIINSLLYFWHCCDCFQDVRMTHGDDVFSDSIIFEENLEMTSSSKRSSNYQFNSNFDLCQVISVKCWNISFNFSTWSTWLILISSSHLPTYPKEHHVVYTT